MTVAVLEALSLGERLAAALPPRGSAPPAARAASARAALPGATRAFMRGVGGVVQVPWALATGNDAPYVPGFTRSPVEKAVNGVFEEVGRFGGAAGLLEGREHEATGLVVGRPRRPACDRPPRHALTSAPPPPPTPHPPPPTPRSPACRCATRRCTTPSCGEPPCACPRRPGSNPRCARTFSRPGSCGPSLYTTHHPPSYPAPHPNPGSCTCWTPPQRSCPLRSCCASPATACGACLAAANRPPSSSTRERPATAASEGITPAPRPFHTRPPVAAPLATASSAPPHRASVPPPPVAPTPPPPTLSGHPSPNPTTFARQPGL
jgi:hypothetical protein